jgi:hypothetical protein
MQVSKVVWRRSNRTYVHALQETRYLRRTSHRFSISVESVERDTDIRASSIVVILGKKKKERTTQGTNPFIHFENSKMTLLFYKNTY